ncbi:hypothetical protein ABT093_19565 [Kitasatospora sp. NPDC002551]|uniref:hypothetical protein n=1 Tax=unclassified Kitasatospora TaxID=2633591 RepID=UPI0033212E8D
MAKNEGGSGGSPVTELTEGWLQQFTNEEIQAYIDGIATNPFVLNMGYYANGTGTLTSSVGTDGKPVTGNSAELRIGTPGNAGKSITEVTASFKAYFGAVDGGFQKIGTQLKNMKGDLLDADLILQTGKEEALTVAQLMFLLGNVVPGGGSSTTTT